MATLWFAGRDTSQTKARSCLAGTLGVWGPGRRGTPGPLGAVPILGEQMLNHPVSRATGAGLGKEQATRPSQAELSILVYTPNMRANQF